jgi:4-amino-4-deoxy-L-arabinose transferase-like glycosyltransferase
MGVHPAMWRRGRTIGTQQLDATTYSEPAAAATSDQSTAREAARARAWPLALDWLAVALAVAVFIAVAAHQWRLPGLYNDEAYDVVPAMQLLLGQPVDLNRGVGLRLFGHDFPLMISDYQGVSSMYSVLPLFAIFGPGVGPVRAMTIGFGAIAILLVYLLGRRLYGRTAGLIAALLLATSPSFIFWSRLGVYVVSQVVPLALGALLCCLRWHDTRRSRWLALAGLLAGIGLSTKVLFIWFIAGAAASGVMVWLVNWWWPLDPQGRALPRRSLRAILNAPNTLRPRDLLAGGAGFLLGAAPLIGYNLASAGTLKVLRANLGQTEKGVDNTDFLGNLAGRFNAFKTVLEGSYFWFLGETQANVLPLAVFIGALLALALLLWRVPAYRRHRAATVFLATFTLAILVQSSVTVSGLEATHLLILLPLPFLLIGAALALLGDWLAAQAAARGLTGRLVPALLALAILAPVVGGNLLVAAHYHEVLARTGGRASFSAAIYILADYLDTPHEDPYDYHRPYALDWGLKYNVELLTAGRVRPQEIYGQGRTLSPDFAATVERLLADPSALYITHRFDGPNAPAAYPDRTREFFRIVEAHGKRVVPIKTIMESDGAPLFYVYTVRDRE